MAKHNSQAVKEREVRSRLLFDGSFWKRIVTRPAVISANNALLLGVAWLIIGAIAAWHFRFVPTSMIGYTTSGYIPLIWHVAFVAVMWISFAVVYFAFGVMCNRETGVVELFGRMLFAHWPLTLLHVPGMFVNRVAYATFMDNAVVAFKTYPHDSTIMAVVALVVFVWALYWGCLAFSRATQRKGAVMLICYVIATMLACYISQLTLEALYRGLA